MTPGDGIPPDGSADKSLGDIVADISDKASSLVRDEIELAKAEVTDKVSKLGKGAGIAAAAGVFLVFAAAMFFHFLAWFFNDLFDWTGGSIWAGFLVVFVLLVLLAAIAAFIAYRLFQRGAPPTPDMAISEAKAMRAQLEEQTIHRDQVQRTLDKGEEVKS